MHDRIEPMTPGDYDAVHALWRAADGVGLSDADSRDGVARFLARNPGSSFVARADGRLVGAVLCGHDGRRGYLHHLAVAPGGRRRGVARALVARCLDALRRDGIQKCHLFVYGRNREAIAFWRRAGFHARGELEMMSREL